MHDMRSSQEPQTLLLSSTLDVPFSRDSPPVVVGVPMAMFCPLLKESLTAALSVVSVPPPSDLFSVWPTSGGLYWSSVPSLVSHLRWWLLGHGTLPLFDESSLFSTSATLVCPEYLNLGDSDPFT